MNQQYLQCITIITVVEVSQQDYHFENTTAAEKLRSTPGVVTQLLSNGATCMLLQSNSDRSTEQLICNGVHITRLHHENHIKLAYHTKVIPFAVLQSCLHGASVVGDTASEHHHEYSTRSNNYFALY